MRELRGKIFEQKLDLVVQRINQAGGFATKLNAEFSKGHCGKVLGEPFDYIITVSGEIHCFDAKTTLSNSFYISGAYPNTAQNHVRRELANLVRIKQLLGNTAMCYFLVWFRGENEQCTIRFDTDLILDVMRRGVKTLLPSWGVAWNPDALLAKCPGYNTTENIAGQEAFHSHRPKHNLNRERTLCLWEALRA